MSKGTFKKVGKSSKTLYGPRAMLVCGFSPREQKALLEFLEAIRIAGLPVVFATDTDGKSLLKTLLARPDQSGKDQICSLDRAIILSGITEKELQHTLSAYRGSGLPRPLWATLTPHSEAWCLSDLLEELKKEREAMEKKQP